VFLAAVVGYLGLVALPRHQAIASIEEELVALAAQRAAAPRHEPSAMVTLPAALAERDLIADAWRLAEGAGVEVLSIKQAAAGPTPDQRRAHVLVRGGFSSVVGFVDAVAATLVGSRIQDMILRRSPQPGEGVELECVIAFQSLARGNPGAGMAEE
jgi:hypothetical protein